MNLPLFTEETPCWHHHLLSVNCYRMFSRVRWRCWALQWPKGHLCLDQRPINFLLEVYILGWVVLLTESSSIPPGFFPGLELCVEAKDGEDRDYSTSQFPIANLFTGSMMTMEKIIYKCKIFKS